MSYQATFERFEQKYILSLSQMTQLKDEMEKHVKYDIYGKSNICNVYYDTLDRRLMRQSMEKPIYKEKLRVRSYGKVQSEDQVFLEIKKKFDGVVYKRRFPSKLSDLPNLLSPCPEVLSKGMSQIQRELNYFVQYYESLQPFMYVAYEREAYMGIEDESFRMTFDQNIVSRTTALDLTHEIYGDPVLPSKICLLEVKTNKALPLWLSKFLATHEIYKTSFSKVARAYEHSINRGGIDYVA